MKNNQLVSHLLSFINCLIIIGLIQVVKLLIDLIFDNKHLPCDSTLTTYKDQFKINLKSNDICYHVNTIDQRNNIPIDQRSHRMIVYVVETDRTYMLETNPMTRYTLDKDWCEINY